MPALRRAYHFGSGPARSAPDVVSISRKIGRGLAMAVLITVATTATTYMIGHGRAVPHALTDGFKLSYDFAAGLAAAAAVATLAAQTKAVGEDRHVKRSVRIAVAFAAVLVCVVGPDFAAGSSPIGASHPAVRTPSYQRLRFIRRSCEQT